MEFSFLGRLKEVRHIDRFRMKGVRFFGVRKRKILSIRRTIMNKRQVLRGGVVLAAIFAVAVFAGSGSVMAASEDCPVAGTWHGASAIGATWMAVASPGANATYGQVVLEWVRWDPTLRGYFPTAVRTTSAMGVWEKVDGKTIHVTFVAYGFDGNGAPLYTIRLIAVSTEVDCDHRSMTYVMEIFLPQQDISKDSPIGKLCGSGTETRMQPVQATCPQ
jgi:hypothetical protein